MSYRTLAQFLLCWAVFPNESGHRDDLYRLPDCRDWDGDWCVRDGGVYYQRERVDGADATSARFVVLQFETAEYLRRYVRSGATVYHAGKVVEAADAATFVVLDHWNDWAIDRSKVYSGSEPLAGADPRRYHFKQGVEGGVEHRYGDDGERVYYGARFVQGVNARRYRTWGDYAFEGKHVYFRGHAVDPSVLAFEEDFDWCLLDRERDEPQSSQPNATSAQ